MALNFCAILTMILNIVPFAQENSFFLTNPEKYVKIKHNHSILRGNYL